MQKAVHHMSLQTWSFDKIVSGEKTLELRLYDDKRRMMNIGDEIIFSDTDHPEKQERTQVTDLLVYPTFDALIDAVPLAWLARESKQAAKDGIYQFYAHDQENQYGVVGIRIKCISD